jgi:putative FmdB family regulatory protein
VPTYDYRCLECGHTVELVHSILEDGPAACEQCGGSVQRVVQRTGVIFRGSGFYVTDSRSSSAGPSEKGSDSSTKGTDSSTKGTDTSTKGTDTSTPAAPSGSGSGTTD